MTEATDATAAWSAGDRLRVFVASGFGSGFSPVAPGTAGTAAAALLVLVLSTTGLPAGPTLATLAVAATLGCFALGGAIERVVGKKDPGVVVLDEFAGYFVALTTFSSDWPGLPELAVAFFLFRLFDVAKPTPARQLQKLPGGPGIVLDDLVAGLYALLGVTVFRHLLENPL